MLETELFSQRYELIVQSVTDYAIYMLDVNGKVLTWNRGAERIKGYTEAEIVGQHFSRFFTKEDLDSGLPTRTLQTAGAEGRFESDGWRVRKDGSRFWANAVTDAIRDQSGAVIGFAKVTRDITEKVELQNAARESDLQFRMLVKGVADYAIYMLDRQGNVSSWNSGAQMIKGYEEAEVVGQHFSRFYTEEDKAAGVPQRALETALREGKFEAEARRVRKDGSLFWAHVVLDPIYDDAGEHVGFAKITRDITERKHAEEELRQAQEALLQSQKLQALGELAGGIAHDFNNLMTVVRGSTDFLLQQPDLPVEKRIRYLHAVRETAERATSLTSQLLAFARRQPLEPEVIDLSVRLDALGEMLQRTLGSAYDLRLDLAPALWQVEIDPTGLETALLNAVLNARDAMPQGGQLTIATKNVSRADGEVVDLSISDTGEGIAADKIQRVFEPFFTTKPTGKGTGLGLSQIHGFATQSGGSAEIVSEVGRGTTVHIFLPRTDKVAEASRAEQANISFPEGLKVLLVEDSEHVRYFARHLLEDLGCQVIEAEDAFEAFSLFEKEDVDLVFSDIVMPGDSGLELAERISARKPGTLVLLASGYSSKQFIPLNERKFPILRKPYRLAALAAALNQLLATAPSSSADPAPHSTGSRSL